MSKLYNIEIIISNICKDKNRDNPKIFQRYLCIFIFPQWSDFCKYYQCICRNKYKDIESFLSVLFEIDSKIVKNVLCQLDIYKDYKISEKEAMQSCCNMKLQF